MSVILYGIKNCDTVRKARKWLTEQQIEYTFVDHRENGLDPEQLQWWLNELGWASVVNKRSTSYRQLTEQEKASLGPDTAAALLQTYPAMIKRPLLSVNNQLYLGFKEAQYTSLFAPK